MGKDPSGGRGMSERGESRRGIKPKGNYSGNHRQPAVSSLSPHEVLCFLFVVVFFFADFATPENKALKILSTQLPSMCSESLQRKQCLV